MSFFRKGLIFLFIELLIIVIPLYRVFSSDTNINTEIGDLINGNVFSYGRATGTILLVEKKTDRLFLVQIKDSIPRIVSEYSVITGQNNGDKLREGDQRTPEGIYFIEKYIPPENLNTMLFGDGAFPINYPNLVDRIHGKTGHGIWIHGRGELTNGRRTNGCISLNNSDLATLKEYLSPGLPVLITEKLDFLAPEKYREAKERYLGYLTDVINAWKNNDFPLFKSYFSESFRSSWNEGYQTYLERKRRLMQLYPEKLIALKDIILYKENSKELMYEYKQLYCRENYIDFGLKRLYFESNNQRKYKIIAEEYDPLPVEPEIENSINDFINKWLASWKKEDINNYISHYSPKFSHGLMNLEDWREYKNRIFKGSDIINIKLKDIKIKVLNDGRIQVRFIQDYESDILKDRGFKTLIIEGCPDNYQIVQEYWRPL